MDGFRGALSGNASGQKELAFPGDYLMGAASPSPAVAQTVTKATCLPERKVNVIDRYESHYAIPKFDLLIDWGWFYFLTNRCSISRPDGPLLRIAQFRRQLRSRDPHRPRWS